MTAASAIGSSRQAPVVGNGICSHLDSAGEGDYFIYSDEEVKRLPSVCTLDHRPSFVAQPVAPVNIEKDRQVMSRPGSEWWRLVDRRGV